MPDVVMHGAGEGLSHVVRQTTPLTIHSLLVQWRTALLATDRAGLAAGAATGDGESVLVTTGQQRVAVGDEGQPDVLTALHHLLRQKLLQIGVANGERRGHGEQDRHGRHADRDFCLDPVSGSLTQSSCLAAGAWRRTH